MAPSVLSLNKLLGKSLDNDAAGNGETRSQNGNGNDHASEAVSPDREEVVANM